MLWHRIAAFIVSNRRALIVLLVLATGLMAYLAAQVNLSYELARILPTSDPSYRQYEQFKARYGEDGNVLALGVETDSMYQLSFFQDWYDLNQQIRQISGIQEVLSNARLYAVVRDDSVQQLRLKPLLDHRPSTQAEVDSVRLGVSRLPFFSGFVADSSGRAHLMAATFNQKTLNAKSRIDIVTEIQAKADAFGRAHNLTVHLSGLPFIRTAFTSKVSRELITFLALAFVVSAVLLFIFFRSFVVVLVASLVVAAGVIWSVGYIVLLGYEITLLTGLIPPLIIVIGIPNAIFLLNRYHEELGQKAAGPALLTAIEKVGETTFFANITTSIGFGVFYFTESPLLLQFGLVAALGIMTTFALSLVLIPAVFSYLPAPTPAQRGHLSSPLVTRFLVWVNTLVRTRRWAIYTFIGAFTVLGLAGMLRLKAIGHVVDDLPQNDPIFTDLKFFEKNFRGVLPFEVSIDTGRPGRVLTPQTLTKIRVLQREFGRQPEFTRPISVAEAIKFFYQGFRGGDPRYYVLPGALELSRMATFAPALSGSKNSGVTAGFSSFIDSTRRYTRVSFQMPDAGTVRIQELITALEPRLDSIFNIDAETGKRAAVNELYDVRLTGNSIVYAKGNAYLLQNLAESTLLAIGLVSLILIILLRDVRLSLIAIVPSIIPLIVTAGIMGIVGIDLKPTTILVFSIAFGLSSDGTIYFITKYRDELRNGADMGSAISATIRRTGVSMVYTAIILFAGFAIFTASTFRGTIALGMLVSVTLLMGMASNLILLPAFLLSAADKKKGTA